MFVIPDETTQDEDSTDQETSEEFVTISRVELDLLRSKSVTMGDMAYGQGSMPDTELARRGSGTNDHELIRESRLRQDLAARDERVALLEKMCKEAIRDRELASMLAGKPLVVGAAAQLIKLWRDEFDVYEEDGAYKVAARDGRKPSQVVGEWLASVDYSHFCLPTSRGGTGARDSTRPSSALHLPEAPKNLGEMIVMKWREELASRTDNLVKPIGLKRRR